MVKIRKKTSKRTSVHMREKIKKRVSESHRKAKKAAKKDVTWKSNKPKDIGIPSKFPFKEELIAEAAAEKERAEQERLAKREAGKSNATLASTAALAAAMSATTEFEDEEMQVEEESLVHDASLKLHAKSLKKVLELSDVIIEVLDARDPVGTRCRAVEREIRSLDGGRKKLVLVLNKIDLVPTTVVQEWLAHLRTQAPTLAFKSSTQQQRSNLSASSSKTPVSSSGSSTKPLMELIKGFRLSPGSSASNGKDTVKQSLTIGLVGHPNVGKSSLINTLKRSKACSVAPTPGWTKQVQEIVLEKGIRILDCPGVVVEARGEVEGALRGMVRPEDVTDVRGVAELILTRCKREHLMMLYGIPAFSDVTDFLVQIARVKGRLRKGGVPDLDGVARSVLRDWVSGRIPYYVPPPATGPTTSAAPTDSHVGTVTSTDVNSAQLLTEFAPAFDLAALFGEADQAAFGDSESNGMMNAVRMNGFSDDAEGDIKWMGDEDKMEDDDGLDVDDLLEDNDDAMEEDVPVGSKRQLPQSAEPPTKKVKAKSVQFSRDTIDNSKMSAAASNIKDLTPENVGLNKNLKKKQKKEKKKAAKVAKEAMEIEKEFGSDVDMPTRPRPARVVKGNLASEPYDFTEFFKTGKQVSHQTGSDSD